MKLPVIEEFYELRTGIDDPHWFVGVRPPITPEVMENLGDSAMHGWAVESNDSATVFRKYTEASRIATRDAAEDLMFRLCGLGAQVVAPVWEPVNMRGLASPFDT